MLWLVFQHAALLGTFELFFFSVCVCVLYCIYEMCLLVCFMLYSWFGNSWLAGRRVVVFPQKQPLTLSQPQNTTRGISGL